MTQRALREHFIEAPEVEILLDRRHADGRETSVRALPEGAVGDRRTRPDLDARLATESHIFLTLA